MEYVDTVAATSLQRRAKANAPAARCWLRRVWRAPRLDECFVQGVPRSRCATDHSNDEVYSPQRQCKYNI